MNWKKPTIKRFLVALILFNLLVPLIFSFVNANANLTKNNTPELATDLKPQAFSIKDYEPILQEAKHGLGYISINGMNFIDWEIGYLHLGELTPTLFDDLGVGLNLTFKEMKFEKTLRRAFVNNMETNVSDNYIIKVAVNETVKVKYNLSNQNPEGYLVYRNRLFPSKLTRFQLIENGSTEIIELNETKNYEIIELNFLKFNYENFFQDKGEAFNFTMYLTWEYNITVSNWVLNQYIKDAIVLNSEKQTVEPKFSYKFNILGQRINTSQLSELEENIVGAENIELNISIDHYDKNLLKNHELKFNNEKIAANKINDYVNPDGTISTDFLVANNSAIFMNFTSEFEIAFQKNLDDLWSIDRLYMNRNRRERLYFPSITAGPEHIYLKNLIFYERNIGIDQIITNSTLFGRGVAYFRFNVSEFEEENANSLVFTKNVTRKQGLKIV
ncbi:MAG: hypothetical protein EU550_02790, partial [Promethearchaeota archaeon]